MNSFKEATEFHYNPDTEPMADPDEVKEFSGLLDIYVHHARNINNICIYENQDVYAKFSLTSYPDETLSTQIINGGGKNPEFNEKLSIKISQPDAVLKCEIWMLSRARNYLEDQLLGFALVPLSQVSAFGKEGRMTKDFTLSSTDLFHSPAGTVKLTLSLTTDLPSDNPSEKPFFSESALAPNSSITSEVVLLDPVEYGRIEFPDISIAKENQRMVSEYFDMAADQNSPCKPACPMMLQPAIPFLHLGTSSQPLADYDMTVTSREDNNWGSISPNGSIQDSSLFCSTTTSISDDRLSIGSHEKKNQEASKISQNEVIWSAETSPKTPTSKIASIVKDNKESTLSNKEEGESSGNKGHKTGSSVELASVFQSPLGDINLEAEQNAMQQQIVDMYMRSMQQFTESLAKMKLPMDLGNPKSEDAGDAIQRQGEKLGHESKKKEGPRVFYGSRAFF